MVVIGCIPCGPQKGMNALLDGIFGTHYDRETHELLEQLFKVDGISSYNYGTQEMPYGGTQEFTCLNTQGFVFNPADPKHHKLMDKFLEGLPPGMLLDVDRDYSERDSHYAPNVLMVTARAPQLWSQAGNLSSSGLGQLLELHRMLKDKNRSQRYIVVFVITDWHLIPENDRYRFHNDLVQSLYYAGAAKNWIFFCGYQNEDTRIWDEKSLLTFKQLLVVMGSLGTRTLGFD